MGGVATEVTEDSRDVVIEAAHFSARGIARMSRRHKLGSEASARFERGVDYELQLRAASRAGTMLATLGGGTLAPGRTVVTEPIEPVIISMAADYPDSVAGVVYGLDTVQTRLQQVGCTVHAVPAGHGEHEQARHDRSPQELLVTPPSWRPDLTDPADLAEEVIRLEGYQNIPVPTARAPAGRGLTARQRLRRSSRPGAGRLRLRRGVQFAVRFGRGLREAAAARRTIRAATPSGSRIRSATTSR